MDSTLMKMKQIKHFFQATSLALLISSSVTVFAQPSDGIVAIVDRSVILQSDLTQAMLDLQQRYQSQGQEIPPSQYLAQLALDQLISRQVQIEQSKRYNIQTDENALNDAVLRVANQAGHKTLEEFQQKLDSQNPGLYASIRKRIGEDLTLSRLRQQIVMSRIKISDQDVENYLKTPQGQATIGTKAHFLHFQIKGENASQVAKQIRTAVLHNNDVNALRDHYQTDKTEILASDSGLVSLTELSPELVARISPLKQGETSEIIPDAQSLHIIKLIERKVGSQQVIVPQYQVRHILIKPSEIMSLDAAKQQIDSLYQRAQAGEDFATLAATFSNDPGSARDGGSLGWVNLGVMVPEFEVSMKNATIGRVSEPFQTQFGWHILQVTNTRQHDMTEEHQNRAVRQILGERQFDTEMENWLREIRTNTYVEIKDARLDPKNN